MGFFWFFRKESQSSSGSFLWLLSDCRGPACLGMGGKKRPCSVCRRWFMPDPRVGERQKTCGRPECRESHRARTQRKWRRRNPDYWAERRLRQQVEQLDSGAGESALSRSPPALMSKVPWEYAQDVIGAQSTVFIAFILRLVHRRAQSEIPAYPTENTEKIDRLPPKAVQSETDKGGHNCQASP